MGRKRAWTILFFVTVFCEICTAGAVETKTGGRPKLIVNIVVSQMRYDYLTRFGANFSDDGFLRFVQKGAHFTSGYYNYMQTLTPVSLATLTTGVNPSMHGVISSRWIDYVTGRVVQLAEDQNVYGLGCDDGLGRYSSRHITLPTLGDKLLGESPRSRVVTVAADPLSAVAMGGKTSSVYWLDPSRGTWISSSGYMSSLPEWIVRYNETRLADFLSENDWSLLLPAESYVNTRSSVIGITANDRKRRNETQEYESLLRSPAGNTMVAEFAKQAVINEGLGKDAFPDILNICFDASRWVGERYGDDSREVEDMFYRLDADLADLVGFIVAQIPQEEVLFVLTSDHGVSDPYDRGKRANERFNADQFKVIMNSFLTVQFGEGDWVLDYIDRQLYLNHNLIYQKNLSLEEVQDRAATFALQFRGVSHVLTATAMRNGYFGDSYGQKMQNGFYPRRAGDLMINLMSGWIEEREGVRALPGSMFDYDTHVPLLWFGWKIPALRVSAPVDMTQVAPTLARILQIGRPIASTGETIGALDNLVEN